MFIDRETTQELAEALHEFAQRFIFERFKESKEMNFGFVLWDELDPRDQWAFHQAAQKFMVNRYSQNSMHNPKT
jgi:hypothetical protein